MPERSEAEAHAQKLSAAAETALAECEQSHAQPQWDHICQAADWLEEEAERVRDKG